eukprot:148940-Rhodomonas_salina.1
MSGTGIAYGAVCLCPRYAMSGTEMAYGPARLLLPACQSLSCFVLALHSMDAPLLLLFALFLTALALDSSTSTP